MLQHAPKEQRRAAMRALREGEAYSPPRPEEDEVSETQEETQEDG